MTHSDPGDFPGGRDRGFRIEHLRRRGSSAAVYEATQLELDRPVALKIFDPGSALGFRLPALRWPEHPNVVRLYAAGTSDGAAFIALQLVNGPTLHRLITGSRVGRRTMRTLMGDVSAALDAAHRAGQVHGAVAAQNIFVDRGRASLAFGLRPRRYRREPRDGSCRFRRSCRGCGGRLHGGDTLDGQPRSPRTAFPRRRQLGRPRPRSARSWRSRRRSPWWFWCAREERHDGSPGASRRGRIGERAPSAGVESVDCSSRDAGRARRRPAPSPRSGLENRTREPEAGKA